MSGFRNRWRIGHYLIADDIHGKIAYDDEVVKRYDGIVMRRQGNEDEVARHPQELVRAWKKDPYPVPLFRDRAFPEPTLNFVDANVVQGRIKPIGAADHLYQSQNIYNIGEMVILPDGTQPASAMACARAFVVRRG